LRFGADVEADDGGVTPREVESDSVIHAHAAGDTNREPDLFVVLVDASAGVVL